jgi:hypothetical protein
MLKNEYNFRRAQWDSNIEKARKSNLVPAIPFYLLSGLAYIYGFHHSKERAQIRFDQDCSAMPTCYHGIFGLGVLVATTLCFVADNVRWGNEQDTICAECEVFKSHYEEFEKFQKKIRQSNLEGTKLDRLSKKIEKTRAQWKQKLDACAKK